MFETVKTVGNLEYYYNADNKLVFRYCDESVGYRVNELHSVIASELDRARAIYRYPTRPFIDSVIELQKESPIKAARYIKYKLLGECSYLDVFGSEFQSEIELKQIQERLDRIEEAISGIKSNYYSQLAAKNFEGRSF